MISPKGAKGAETVDEAGQATASCTALRRAKGFAPFASLREILFRLQSHLDRQ